MRRSVTVAGLSAFAMAMHLLGTWSLPLLDRDEPRFAEASREMRERHDFLVPYFNNGYRFDKPPLSYWAQVLAFRVAGESEWAARCPSALASAFTALLIYGFGRRACSERAGLWGALIFTTSLQTLIHSKLALADAWMVCFVTLGAWAGWELCRSDGTAGGRSRPWWAVLLSVALALGFLAKGPIGWVPLGMVLAGRPWTPPRRVLSAGALVLIVGGSLALIALWAVPALAQTHGEFFRVGIGRHVVARGLVSLEGHGASRLVTYVALLPFYFVTVFVSFFPWSIFLPWLVARLWRRQARTGAAGYLGAGVFLTFLVFTLFNTKLPHYTWPAFPFLALLLAREWEAAARPIAGLRLALAGMVAFNLAVSLAAFPLVARFAPSATLAARCQPWLRPEMEFGSTGYDEPSLVWYFRKSIRGFYQHLAAKEAREFMAKPGPRLCILPAEEAARLFAERPSNWRVVSSEGINFANGRRVDLRALVKLE